MKVERNPLIDEYIMKYNLNDDYTFYQHPLDTNHQSVTWTAYYAYKEFRIILYKDYVKLKASDSAKNYHSANFSYIKKVQGFFFSHDLAGFLQNCGFTK